jgi:hypothetical protein
VVLGSIVLWFCTGRRVLLVEVTVKSGMAELKQALEALRCYVRAGRDEALRIRRGAA